MKKLLFIVTLAMILGVSVYSQTEKKFNLTPATAKDFEPATAPSEDFKESCLHNFYNALLSSPHIIGLPDDYNKFKTALLNPEKSLAFYNSMMANSCLRGVVPATYQGFLSAYGLDKKPDVNPDVSSVFQSLPANALDDYYNHKLDEMKQQELSSERNRLVRQFEFEQEISSQRETMEQELSLIHEQRLELEREMEHRYKQERTNSIFDASRLVIDAIGGSMGATIPDYYNQNQWQMEQDDYIIQPTLPGTNIIDYNRSGYKREGNTIYQTLPGTEIKDFSKPGIKIEGGMAYPTLPGTNIRDFSKPGYRIEKKNK
jgi:hypothetical protein